MVSSVVNDILREARTKIVVTLGPASSTPKTISGLIAAGADVFRLNFSHGTHEGHERLLGIVRQESKKMKRHVAVLQDLSGTKIRLGSIPSGPLVLSPEAAVTLTTRDVPGDAGVLPVNYDKLPKEVCKGDMILLGDGAVELEIKSVKGKDVKCVVVVGGEVGTGKGVNVPGGKLSAGGLTGKDRKDLAFGIRIGVDMVALSFVRTADDIREIKELMSDIGTDLPVIAKIERHECVENIEDVMDASDGVMVARGDLGIDVPIERLPILQKRIVSLARGAGRPVIIATQMLKSMVESRRPTRAEAADVANAVLDGTDAVMLSEETSVGAYPVESVEIMHRIAAEAEKVLQCDLEVTGDGGSTEEAISESACRVAIETGAAAIVVPTFSGSTAIKVARFRPPIPIIALSPNEATLKLLCLVWGVIPQRIDPFGSVEDAIESSRRAATKICGREGRVVLTAGLPLGEPGRTNLIKVVDLEA